jgi:hypothetical protein
MSASPIQSSTPLWERTLTALALALGAVAVFLAIYLFSLDRVAGHTQDDAWYMLLAQALATGQGFTLINSPTPGIHPMYPPGFPFLLSLVFRVFPRFPENVLWLKAVSVLAMFGVGILSYHYFVRYRQVSRAVALGIALATVTTQPLIHLATSTVMSECVFTLLQLLTLSLLERHVREQNPGKARLLLGLSLALAVACLLTRTMAIGLLAVIPVYLFRQRLRSSALIFAAGIALLYSPWLYYSRAHTPTPEQRAEQRGLIVTSYSEHFWDKLAGDEARGTITLAQLPARVWENTMDMLGRGMGMVVVSPLFTSTFYSYVGWFSFVVSLFVILGFVQACRNHFSLAEMMVLISLAITVLWPFFPTRFLLPLLPLLLFYFLLGLESSVHFLQRKLEDPRLLGQWKLSLWVLGLLLVSRFYEAATFIWAKHQARPEARPDYVRNHEENQQVLDWVKENLPAEAVLVSENPQLVYLHTGRKTVSRGNLRRDWEILEKIGARYWVRLSTTPLGLPTMEEKRYTILYRSAGPLQLRVIDLGSPGHRTRFGE